MALCDKYRSTKEIYETLKHEIVHLQYVPGQQISENEMAQRFSVSRTPVKAAFTRLESEGFIFVVPQRGSFVSQLDTRKIKELIFMRTVLESEIASALMDRLSADTLSELKAILEFQQKLVKEKRPEPESFYLLDVQFHGLLFEKSGHAYLWEEIQRMELIYTRFRILDIKLSRNFAALYREHKGLFEALKSKDARLYRERIEQHLGGNLMKLKQLMNGEIKDYFVNAD